MPDDMCHKKIFAERLKQRLRAEETLLAQKLRRIQAYMASKEYSKLSADDSHFVRRLELYMSLYHDILFEGMERMFTPEDWQKKDGMFSFVRKIADKITR